jgi:tRNA-dihydrouridine synthase
MADVTDAAFRRVIAKYGRPDVMWTEFVAADGLMRATPEGKAKLIADLIYSEEERPIVAQLFSSNEAHMEAAAALCLELGFDGVDINMGCPDQSIEKLWFGDDQKSRKCSSDYSRCEAWRENGRGGWYSGVGQNAHWLSCR